MTAVPESSGGLLANRNFVLLWQGQFVSQAGNQAPKFGKIKDLVDEGGTYFFIKK